jgi:hypothetical protein
MFSDLSDVEQAAVLVLWVALVGFPMARLVHGVFTGRWED